MGCLTRLHPSVALLEDVGEDSAQVSMNQPILESENLEAQFLQYFVTLAIVLAVVPVARPIDLHNEGRFAAVEVNNEPADHLLAPEVKSTELVSLQSPP
jgi:hypothetical protein